MDRKLARKNIRSGLLLAAFSLFMFGLTFVIVTHDLSEAVFLAERITLLHHGHVLKCGPRSWRTKASPAS